LSSDQASKFITIFIKNYEKFLEIAKFDNEEEKQENYEINRKCCEMYLFLWFIINENQNSSSWYDAKVFNCVLKTIKLNLDVLFVSSVDLDLVLIDLVFKSMRNCLEMQQVKKSNQLKDIIMEILQYSAVNYQSANTVLESHLIDFIRNEDLSEFIALLISGIMEKSLTESLIKRLGSFNYCDNDSKLSKSVSKFLIKLSEIQPKGILKHMIYLQPLLDSESSTIRAAMVDTIGNVIHFYLAKDDDSSSEKNLLIYYDIISQRFLDTDALVRTRVLKVLLLLCQ
jgi:condensin complex subunit 1